MWAVFCGWSCLNKTMVRVFNDVVSSVFLLLQSCSSSTDGDVVMWCVTTSSFPLCSAKAARLQQRRQTPAAGLNIKDVSLCFFFCCGVACRCKWKHTGLWVKLCESFKGNDSGIQAGLKKFWNWILPQQKSRLTRPSLVFPVFQSVKRL